MIGFIDISTNREAHRAAKSGAALRSPNAETPLAYTRWRNWRGSTKSNGDNFIGLRAVTATGTFYGYAFTTNNVLNTVGFETRADTAVTAIQGVPEPASWAMMVGGMGLAGLGMRRRRRSAAIAA